MQKHPELTVRRLRKALNERIEPLLYPRKAAVEVEAWDVKGEPVDYATAMEAPYESFQVGTKWGSAWDTWWFRFRGEVPASWAGEEVYLLVDLGSPWKAEGFTCEGMIWRDGKVVEAVNINRADVTVGRPVKGGEAVEIYLEAGANSTSSGEDGRDLLEPSYGGNPIFTLKQAELATFDREAWVLFHDYRVCLEAIENLPKESPRRAKLLYGLNQALNYFEEADRTTWETVRGLIAPLLAAKNGSSAMEVSAVGHAHIDTAWLWPLRETMRKCARTFTSALNYMEDYPEYVFVCSQAVQYAWMKAKYPEVYARIGEAIKRGQWEPVGSMWVEPDTNLASGESLVRQILHGKGFFREEFGYETEDIWLPDVFGYSASFPQIMEQAGIRYFLTQKISWNQFNRFPHHTFLWEGIDGTRIFTHFPPADTYNGDFTVGEIHRIEEKFLEHDRANRALEVYGYGDGGGGPTKQMLETAARLKDFEGIPKVTLETCKAFFQKAEEDAVDPPVWVGELYLELHRGTYTTQAKNKLGNRKGEFVLREAEFADAMSTLLRGADGPAMADPASERAVYDVFEHARGGDRRGRVGALDRAWKLLLLNQFHDIIPGSSINWVYRDSDRDYATIMALGEAVQTDSIEILAKAIDTGEAAEPILVMNSLSLPRAEVVRGPEGEAMWLEAPSCGYAVNDGKLARTLPEGSTKVTVTETDGGLVIENGLIRVTLDEEGLLSSVYDLWAEREVLAEGERGNLLQLHQDIPNNWDAWDVDIFHRETVEDLTALDSMEVEESGPMRVVVRIERRFGDSHIIQRLVIRAESTRLDFETELDWQEKRKLLKVAFPVAIHSPRATYEIQYGHLERPTHMNTSWDMARFEVCAHKWADLSEGDYGVALLNDCKYGHDIFGNVMRLSLLRSPQAPDPEADRGKHTFTYALLPHEGDFRTGSVIEEAYALNVPLQVRSLPQQTGQLEEEQCWLEVDRPGVIIEAIKLAEDGSGDLIVRLYEAFGTRGRCTLSTQLPVQSVTRCDLLETPGEELEIEDGMTSLTLKPFEIVSLRFGR